MMDSKSLGNYLVDEIGGELLEEKEEFSRYDAVLENFLVSYSGGIGEVVQRFYLHKGFKHLSGDSMMFNFSKNGVLKSVVLTYDSSRELLKVRCDSIG